jgi:prephenate dehydrogenase
MAPLSDAPVAIIGLGLIGGSLARALLAAGVPARGWAADTSDREDAARAGLTVRDADSDERGIAEAVADAEVVVLAVPLPELAGVSRSAVAAAAPGAVIVHTGGLQRVEATGLEGEVAARVVGTHPLAGSHEAGFPASRVDLFAGCGVSAEERASARERDAIERLWRAAGAARIDWRSADDHDAFIAAASHLPQLVATALAATLEAQGIALRDVGLGARDTSRLAASPFPLWEGLLFRGGDDLEIALAAYQGTLAALGRAVAKRDGRALGALWERGRAWRTGEEAS